MKITFRDRVRSWFDDLMSKGTPSLVAVLFLATTLVIAVVGLILALIGDGETSLLGYFWVSLMHVIDAGTITGADTADASFIILMSVATLCGIFVTSILIGIINTAFEEKLSSLRKGNSRVIANNHVIILGFNSNVYTLISELIIANENRKDGCIVILAEEDKESVEEAIAAEISDFKTTKIICRTGSMTDKNMLANCSPEAAKSIIINQDVDFMTIKTIITINSYFDSIGKRDNLPHIVSTINSEPNRDVIDIISKGNNETVLIGDSISRIIAQSCRQPGLSSVMVELFDYDGDEFYMESFPGLYNVKFGDALNYFEKAVLFGYKRNGEIHLNPDKETLIEKEDKLILLVEDDGVAKPIPYKVSDISHLSSDAVHDESAENIMIIGVNDILQNVISELDDYLTSGSTLYLANDIIESEIDEFAKTLRNVALKTIACDTTQRENLENLVEKDINHILLLSDYNEDNETSDAITLFKLIHLRDIAKKTGKNFSITSEMRDTANQKLAEVARANDLVVGSNIINLILSQICENRDLARVFENLLRAEGSEIYIRKASKYIKLHTETNFFEITEILRKQNHVAVGYKKQNEDGFDIIMNPLKSEKIVFNEDDCIIMLSDD